MASLHFTELPAEAQDMLRDLDPQSAADHRVRAILFHQK